MAKGSSRLVVATVVVAAVIAVGNTRSHDGDRSSTQSTFADPPGTSFPTAQYAPVPGQREKDQEPAPGGAAVELVADPVADECVLTAAEVQDLIGAPVERVVMTSVPGADERPLPGCVAMEGENQLVLMNVYEVRNGSPADAVRGGRSLDGVGTAASIVDARVGPTLQVAGRRFLVTIEVAFRNPTDDAWRRAGTAALDRLE